MTSNFNVMPVTLFGVELNHDCTKALRAKLKQKIMNEVHENGFEENCLRLPDMLDELPLPQCEVPELKFVAVTEEIGRAHV